MFAVQLSKRCDLLRCGQLLTQAVLHQPFAEATALSLCVVACKVVSLRLPLLAGLPVGCLEDGTYAAFAHRSLLCPLRFEAPECHVHPCQAADWMRCNAFASWHLQCIIAA